MANVVHYAVWDCADFENQRKGLTTALFFDPYNFLKLIMKLEFYAHLSIHQGIL